MNGRRHRALATIAAATIALSAATGAVASASPAEVDGPSTPDSSLQIVDRPLTDEELRVAEKQAEHIFTDLIVQDNYEWVVNEQLAHAEGVDVDALAAVTQVLNQPSPEHSVSSPGYRQCVLNAVGLGGLTGGAAGGGSQLAYLIATKNFKEVAWVLARLVGVNALKGGVAGATAALVGAGAWCATPFAK
ncbi:hypothetical protein [Rhodococcus rhodnii]|uniref:hypothetical protein n=1 Tax=Rhodococcus rhodnii TaxID=38312 RepID=UPI000A4FD9BF|nr:hypothetical protein [Rhodococcus rhodnii]